MKMNAADRESLKHMVHMYGFDVVVREIADVFYDNTDAYSDTVYRALRFITSYLTSDDLGKKDIVVQHKVM